MMSVNLGDILKKLGWEDGFQIPIANDENRALEAELASLSLRKSKGRNKLEVVCGRLDALKDHFKFVAQENEQTQKLITSHKQQLDFIEHQYHVSKSEQENTERSTKSILKKMKEAQSRQEIKRADLQKHVSKADQLQNEMDWDSKALKAWEETLKKREEDNELIQKFSKEDEMRFNLLEAKRQHLQGVLADMRTKVAKISSSAYNCELILERSGKVMKQLFLEREALTFQWKEAIKMMQQRDNDVTNMQDQIVTTLEAIQKKEEKLVEENNFLNNEQRNNRDLEFELQKVNAINSRTRNDLNELTQHMLFLNSELQTVKREVATSAQHLQNERTKAKRLTQFIEEKTILCDQYAEDVEKMKSKMEEMRGSTLTSNERIKKIENMIDKEEKLHSICVTDTDKINSTLYRLDKLLLEQKEIGKTLELNINNATCNCTQLRRHIRQLKKDLEDIKEVVYDMEFRIDDIEKKLYKMEEETKTDEDTEEKDKIIQELEKILSYHKDVQHTLQIQVDRLQEEMRRVANVIASDKAIFAGIQNKCEHLMLVYEIGQKQIAAAKKITQEKQVEENMIRLRVHQIEKVKQKEEKNIFSLEKLRLNLNQAMKERQVEINTKKTIIQAKRKNLEEDRGRLNTDIGLRLLKIEQIKKKYHFALTSLGQSEEGEQVSISHFKIKNAQEKYILQQAGDELDQKIQTTEKEIVAMENTLKLINLSNHTFKNSLSPVKDNDEEIEEMKRVEEELKKMNIELKLHKTNINQREQELKDIQSELSSINKLAEEYREIVSKLEEEIQSVKQQEMDKKEKVCRANCRLKSLLQQLEKQDVSHYERDFEIRQIRDLNKNVQKQLLLLGSNHPETLEEINRLANESNIQLPRGQLTPSTSGSSYSTLRSCSSSKSSRCDTNKDNSASISTFSFNLDP